MELTREQLAAKIGTSIDDLGDVEISQAWPIIDRETRLITGVLLASDDTSEYEIVDDRYAVQVGE